MRLIQTALMTACVVSACAPVVAWGQEAARLTLEGAIATALKDNPSLRAARLGHGVAAAEIEVAGQRPNPDVSYEAARETPHQAVTFSVPVEAGGKRDRRIASARATVATTDAELVLAEADLRASVRQAFFGLAAAEQRVSISLELLAIGERARAAAQARVRAGDAARFELLQSELVLARLDNDVAASRGAVHVAETELNTLLGRDPAAALAVDASLARPVDVEALSALLAPSLRHSADLAVLDRRVDEATARLDVSRALRVPDPTLQASLVFQSPPEFTYGWRAGVSVTVPLFTRYTAPVARDSLAVDHARALRDAGQQASNSQTAAALARVRALADQQARDTTVLQPHSLEVERMAEDAYRAGQIDLPALLQALQMGRDVRIRALDTSLALQAAVADLERAAGVVLP